MEYLTINQIKSIAKDWSLISKETVEVEYVKGTLYGYCTELAALRLAYKYRGDITKSRAFYSENLKTWVFALDINN